MQTRPAAWGPSSCASIAYDTVWTHGLLEEIFTNALHDNAKYAPILDARALVPAGLDAD